MNKKYLFPSIFIALVLIASFSYFFFLVNTKKEITRKEKNLSLNLSENTTFINTYFQNIENEFLNFIQKMKESSLLQNMKNGEELSSFIHSQAKSYLFEPLIYVSKSGDILYGEGKGKNIYKDQFGESELHLALTRAHLTQTLDRSRVTYSVEEKQEVIYLTFPLGSSLGVISFPLKLNSFQRKVGQNEEEIAIFQANEGNTNIIASSFAQYNGQAFSQALHGHDGSGITTIGSDKTIAAWGFIPRLNWGVIVKTSYLQAIQPFRFLKVIFYVATILLICALAAFFFLKYHTFFLSHAFFRLLSLLVLLISLVAVGYSLYGFYAAKEKSVSLEKELVVKRLNDFLETTSLKLNDVVHTTEWLAKDLSSKKVKQEDLFIRLKRDFKEIPSLQKMLVAFNPPPYLAYEIVRNHEEKMIKYSDDTYTKDAWYSLGKSKKNEWSIFYDEESGKEMSVYTSAFFDGVQGTIFTFFDFSSLVKELEELPLGAWGRGFYLLEEGVIPGSSLSTLEMKKGEFYSFTDKKTGEKVYVTIEKIPNTPWIVGGKFTASDLKIDADQVHTYTLVLITALFLLSISLLIIFCHGRTLFSILFVLFGSLALLAIWITEHLIVESTQISGFIINDRVELDNFKYIVRKNASDLLLEEPIFIPTGTQIQFLELQSNDFLSFSGLVWQKYPKKLETIGVFFPQATSIALDKIVTSNPLIDTWRVRASLVQKPDKSAFPFDDYLIKIQIRSLNENPALYLIPDLEGYRNLVAKNKLGISQNFSIPGYKLNQTFFSLEKEEPQAYLTGQESKERALYTLYYNIYLVRNFLTPFLPFLIPLLVIQIGLFAIFLLTKKEKRINFMTSISVYTGGFFAFAILQLNLRTQYPSDNILYGETFFFVGYLLICLLYAHAILLRNAPKESFLNTHKPLLNSLFWPLQVVIWYIIALIYFS